jgi:hypothetical protein
MNIRKQLLFLASIAFVAPHMTPALAVAMGVMCMFFAFWL